MAEWGKKNLKINPKDLCRKTPRKQGETRWKSRENQSLPLPETCERLALCRLVPQTHCLSGAAGQPRLPVLEPSRPDWALVGGHR